MQAVNMRAIVDAHVHLRQDDLPTSPGLCSRIAHYSGRCCDHIIVMPNTKPPIHEAEDIVRMHDLYKKNIGHPCEIHMTAKWLQRTTSFSVKPAKTAGAIGFKLYPQGATTNADDGIPFDWLLKGKRSLQTTEFLKALEEENMVLMCHGEAPGFVMRREALFLKTFENISDEFPNLRMTLEHITTEQGLLSIRRLRDKGRPVLGTITLHHMMTDLDDVIGHGLQPDLYCMPIPKTPEDMQHLIDAALSGDECFAFGSDSAPHDPKHKYCASGCAGVFTAPVTIESLVELFRKYCSTSGDALVQLDKFAVENALKFYGFKHSGRMISLIEEEYFVPALSGLVTTFRGGTRIPWRLQGWWEKQKDQT